MKTASSCRISVRAALFWALGMAGQNTLAAADASEAPEARLTNPAQIHQLSYEQANCGLPVRLEGVVTYYERDWNFAFIQDGDSAIYLPLHELTNTTVRPGQVLRVEGITAPGDFAPIVAPRKIEVVGQTNLPPPQPRILPELLTGKDDCLRVELKGLVQSATKERSVWVLRIATETGWFPARVAGVSEDFSPTVWVDSVVRVRGSVSSIFNNQRQLLGVRLMVPGAEEVVVEGPAARQQESLPVQSISTLLRYNPYGLMRHRTRVRGLVLYQKPGDMLFIHDEQKSLLVRSHQETRVQPGDWVDVAGFPGVESGKTALLQADFHVIGHDAPPSAPRVQGADMFEGDHDGQLVQCEGLVLGDWVKTDQEWLGVLRVDKGIVLAQWHPRQPQAAMPALEKGSRVRLTGICWNTRDEALQINGTRLLPRGPADLAVVRPAPWWTPERSFGIMGLSGVGALAALLWAVMLQRQIRERQRAEQKLRESEALYESLVQTLPACVLRKDLEGRVVFGNQQYLQLLGRSLPELLGKTDFDLFPPELARKYRADDERVLQSGTPFEGVEQHKTPGGEELFVQVWKTPVRDAQGRPAGIQVLFWDITERERAKQALAYERDLLEMLLQNIPDHVYFKDRQSRFVKCSKSFAAGLAISDTAKLLGKTDFDLFTEEHARPAFEDEQRIMRTGQPIVGLVERETWQGGLVSWVLTTKVPWRDKAGNIIGTFGISKDITALKQAEERLEQTHHQLVQASRQAGMAEVATGVLHNVGNVLNSVNVSANLVADRLRQAPGPALAKLVELLRQHHGDLARFLTEDPRGQSIPDFLEQLAACLADDQQVLLGEIQSLNKNVQHINEIVAMQQNYARIVGLIEQVNLTELIEDALRLNTGAYMRHQVEVAREFSDLPPIQVERHRVLQILVNLLSNAKYACDAVGRADKRITVRTRPGTGGRVFIDVADNGIGIASENLTRIFSHGYTTRKNGHGFGLHTSALAAKEMGGSLTAASDGPGHGATFTIALPPEPPASLNLRDS
jgi:PAS domain S-box-containing protein